LTSIQLISQLLRLRSIELNLSVKSISLFTGFLLYTSSLMESSLRDLFLMLQLSGFVRALPHSLKESKQGVAEELSLRDLQLFLNLRASDGASGLTLQASYLSRYLFNDVIKPNNLRLSIINALRYRVHVLTESSDMGGFLDNDTPIIWFSGNDPSDLTLGDNRVPPRGEAYHTEKFLNILETTWHLVEEELGLTTTIETTSNLHLSDRLKP
jgi:hypothetical protein